MIAISHYIRDKFILLLSCSLSDEKIFEFINCKKFVKDKAQKLSYVIFLIVVYNFDKYIDIFDKVEKKLIIFH